MSDFSELLDEEHGTREATSRLLLRSREEGSGELPAARRSMRTSMSIVLTPSSGSAEAVIEELVAWSAPEIRAEILVVNDSSARLPVRMREQLERTGMSYRVVRAPEGPGSGRAATLAAAIGQAMHEVVMLASDSVGTSDLVRRALWCQWVDGADIALVPAGPDGAPGGDLPPALADDVVPDELDAATELAAWLGLGRSATAGGGCPTGPRVVLMRRWVARWLFSELERAIDPAEEIADRARLLGVAVVRLCDGTTLPTPSDSRSFEGLGGR